MATITDTGGRRILSHRYLMLHLGRLVMAVLQHHHEEARELARDVKIGFTVDGEPWPEGLL